MLEKTKNNKEMKQTRPVPSVSFFGGDEESRTPVHNTFHIDFYKFSLFFLFITISPTNRINYNISF